MEENQEKLKRKQESIANLYIELSKNLGQNEQIKSIEYYEQMSLISEKTSKYAFELNTLIVEKEVENEEKEKITVYELYDDENNNIGKVEDGKIYFNQNYLEMIKERYKNNDYIYNELVEQNGKIDYKEILERNQNKGFKMTEKQITDFVKEEYYEKSTEDKQQKNEEQNEKQEEKRKTKEQIAKEKGVPANNIAFVREDSYLYKNHPELERNLFFYRDKDGIVKAEYIDKEGNVQQSNYIEDSKSYMRSVVSIGKDGEKIEREVPHQFMTTNIQSKGLNVREIGISVNFNMGYLEIDEARLGSNGEWTSHEIEMEGRGYNSHEVNEQTDLQHKSSNPDKISEGYENMEDTGFNEDGIQIDELNVEKIIQKFMEEGYQRFEAIDIINYMIGEEKLTEDQAKSRVNDEIMQRRENEEKLHNQEREIEEEDDRERGWPY